MLRNQKNKTAILVLMLSVVLLGTNSSANTVLSKIMADFPDVPATTVRLIATLPSVFTTILTLMIGPVIGKKISYKTVCVLALAFITFGGAGPIVLNSSIAIILVCRAIYGIGLGLFSCRNGYAVLLCEGELRKSIISTITLINNISAVVMQLICGWLGDIRWPYAFIPFLYGLLPLALAVLFLREPNAEEGQKEAPASSTAETPARKKGVSPWSWMYCLLIFVFTLCGLTWMTGMSSLLTEKGITDASSVGVAISACSAGGILGSFIFGFVSKNKQKLAVTVAAALGAAGAVIAVIASSVPMMILAGLLAGSGYLTAVISCNTFAALSNVRENVTNATTNVMAVMAVATFLTGWFIDICGKYIHIMPAFTANAFAAAIVIQAAIAVISLFFNFGPRPPQEN